MKLTQDWIGYASRSYEQIKKSILKRLPINNPEITDHTEGNILIVLIGIFSGIGEMLNYYIDQKGRESYLGTARRFTSIVRITKLMDYRIKASWYASADILFTLTDSTGNPILATSVVYIPRETLVTDANGLVVRTISDQTIPIGQYATFSSAVQYENVANANLGSTNGTPLQKIELPFSYVDATLALTINGVNWSLYDSLGLMLNSTKGFTVDILEDGKAYIIFGDGLNGAIPPSGFSIIGNYKSTKGSTGNVPPNSLVNIITPIVVPPGTTIIANNPDYANAGSDFEGIEDIRNRAPRALRSLLRAVTKDDYIDVTLQHPGVSSAEVSYCCGKFIDIYIIPKSKGVGTLALIQDVKAYLDCRKMITTQIAVKASGISKIWVKATIKLKPLFNTLAGQIEVINKLDTDWGFNSTIINRKINISDLIQSFESCDSVDSVAIEQVKVQPYARPSSTTDAILNIEYLTLPTTTVVSNYTIIFKILTNTFEIYKEAILKGTIAIDASFNDGQIVFKIHSGTYNNNDTWTFKVVPSYPEIFPLATLTISDYTAAIIDIGPLVAENIPKTIFSNLTFVEQTIQSKCLPNC